MKRMIMLGCFVMATFVAGAPCFAQISSNQMSFGMMHMTFKMKPGSSWKDAIPRGNGSCSGGGCTSKFPAIVDGIRYNITLNYEVSESFDCLVQVEPQTTGTGVSAKEFRVPISDLQSTTVELLRESDGRVLYLSMMPTLTFTGTPEPKPADDADFLRIWKFSSIVLLNDHQYVGRLNMNGGPIAWFEIAGVGIIRMSLLPFGDAKVMGALTDGTVEITGPEKQKVEIHNVKFGYEGVTLPDGPYKVFVEWSDSSENAAALVIAAIKKRLDKKPSTSGTEATAEWLARLERGEPAIVSNGVGPE